MKIALCVDFVCETMLQDITEFIFRNVCTFQTQFLQKFW